MVCKNCGKEIADGLTVCPECGAATATVSATVPAKKGILDGYKNFGSLSTVSKILHIAIPVVAIVVVILILSAIFSTDYVDVVKDGMLYYISDDETVGEAFEDFFANPEWESFETEDGEIIVEFNGECEFYGDEADCCIQFEVDEDGEEFEVVYIDIDGESMNDFEIVSILEAIYEE